MFVYFMTGTPEGSTESGSRPENHNKLTIIVIGNILQKHKGCLH